MEAATGMGGGGGQVEAPDGRRRPAESGEGAEDRLLVELGGAPVDRAADQVAVVALEVERGLDLALEDPLAEAGGQALDLFLDPVGEALALLLAGPVAAQLSGGIRARVLREVGVGPGGL